MVLITTIASAAMHLRQRGFPLPSRDRLRIGSAYSRAAELSRCAPLPTARLEFIELHPDRLKAFPLPSSLQHVTLATNSRLLLQELLPEVELNNLSGL